MRVRCHMRRIRKARGLSLGDVVTATGIARGELSMFERGHSIPRDDQLRRLEAVYGEWGGWWPATVRRALLGDAADCLNCGDELEPDASGARRFHDENCRAEYHRTRRTRDPGATVV